MKNMINRADFLKTTAAASAFMIMKPSAVFGSKANSEVRLGIIGCGNRGTHDATNMCNTTNTRVVAIADIFEDQLNKGKSHFNDLNKSKGQSLIAKNHLFFGHDAYKRLIDLNDVDAVLISAPGYVHPQYATEAIEAGKHVYCEKPVAVDAPGVQEMLSAGKKLKKGQSATIGFQVRAATPFVELIKRVKRGDIGDIVSVQLHYYAAGKEYLWPADVPVDKMKIINHYAFNALSGGIFLDQAIHLIDVTNWALGTDPLESFGSGSQKGRNDRGDAWSNYQVFYKYPDNINVSVSSAQIGPEWGDQGIRFIGTGGIAEAHFSGQVFIIGKNPWDAGILSSEENLKIDQRTGLFASLYDADINKAKNFIDSITSGNAINEIESGCRSTFAAIMGRDAARSGEKLTWNDVINSDKRRDHGINLKQFPTNS